MAEVRRGPARIAYRVEGEGPPVLLLASLGRGAEDFDAVAPRIAAAGFRVVRPEPRGLGGSAGPMEGLTLYDLAADAAAALVDAAGAVPAIVAGHAFGNWVARALAVSRPELVKGVVLLAASVTTEMPAAVRASINGSFDPALSEAERLGHLQRGYFAPGHDARVWLGGWYPAVAAMQRAATAATPDQVWRRVAERVQTLYVSAAEDTIAPPPSLEQLRAALGPQVSMVGIADAGHALLPEQPEATADAVIAYAQGLARIPLPGPEAMTLAQRAVHDGIVGGPRGTVIGPLRAVIHNPELAARWSALGEILRFGTSLPKRLVELAILVTGRRWGSQIEWWVHARVGAEAGLPADAIEAIRTGAAPRFADAEEALVYDFARALQQNGQVPLGLYRAAEARWGAAGVVELVAVVGYYTMVSMTLNAHEIPLPAGIPAPLAGDGLATLPAAQDEDTP